MEGFCFEKVDNILYLTADGNYTNIYFIDGRQILVCRNLASLERNLAQYQQFIRIHRSHTINLVWLLKYVRGKTGYVVMENGATINISAGKKAELMEAIENYF